VSVCPVATGDLYDEIGRGYSAGRRTDPWIAQWIWLALGDARRVLNVGAGAGSYEPPGRDVVAVEPSAVMRAQRPLGAAACLSAVAEDLPFADESFDAAMAVLSDHHWSDPIAGLREMLRVARRVVVFQLDRKSFPDFWMVRDYLPEVAELARRGPTLEERARAIGATVRSVPIRGDCVDGFFHAYWRRPAAYLDPETRRATSVWDFVGRDVEERAVAALAEDLDSGAWQQRHGHLRSAYSLDVGARLLVASR
jgi:SAM-dependent methyltransferase